MRKQKIKSEEEKDKKINFLIGLGYSEEDANKNRLKVSSNNSYLYWMYNGLSKEESIEKVSEIQKSKSPRCKEYWINRGYNENDAVQEISKYQDNVSLEFTLNNGGTIDDYKSKCSNRKINKEKYISLYGEDEGMKKWEERKNKSKITLDNMIRVYGEDEGRKRWKSYIENQKYSQSHEGLTKNHGEEKASEIINFRSKLNELCIGKFLETGNHKYLKNNFSKSSQKLFWNIYNRLPIHLKEKCYFKELNHEFVLVLNGNKNCYLYDFVISNINLCIEFNGDIWHANPNTYNSNDNIFEKKAHEIWEKDERKIKLLKENRNIDTITIWESEWKKDKINVEDNILKKILDIYDNNIRKGIRPCD